MMNDDFNTSEPRQLSWEIHKAIMAVMQPRMRNAGSQENADLILAEALLGCLRGCVSILACMPKEARDEAIGPAGQYLRDKTDEAAGRLRTFVASAPETRQ